MFRKILLTGQRRLHTRKALCRFSRKLSDAAAILLSVKENTPRHRLTHEKWEMLVHLLVYHFYQLHFEIIISFENPKQDVKIVREPIKSVASGQSCSKSSGTRSLGFISCHFARQLALWIFPLGEAVPLSSGALINCHSRSRWPKRIFLRFHLCVERNRGKRQVVREFSMVAFAMASPSCIWHSVLQKLRILPVEAKLNKCKPTCTV